MSDYSVNSAKVRGEDSDDNEIFPESPGKSPATANTARITPTKSRSNSMVSRRVTTTSIKAARIIINE